MENPLLSVKQTPDATLVQVHVKKLYQNVVGRFQEEMIAIVERGDRNLVVNLAEVDVMNSSGLGVLILVWDRLKKEGGKVVVAGLRPLMHELFIRMHLDTLFTLVDTEKKGLDLFQKK